MKPTAQGDFPGWPIATHVVAFCLGCLGDLGRMKGEIAGDPKLSESMDGSTGNRNPPRQEYLAEGHYEPWMTDEGFWNHHRSGCGANEVNSGRGDATTSAAPVEGDFGGDFVRRNRSQLHHGTKMPGDGQ